MAARSVSGKARKKAAAAKPAVRQQTSTTAKTGKHVRSAASRKERPKGAATKAREEFVRGVLARGEAAKAGKRGELPPGATHEIVDEAKAGLPKLRRRRFSLA